MEKKTNLWAKRIKNLFTLLSDMYALYLSLLILLWLITGEKLFFVNIFVSLSPGIFYFLPLIVLIAIVIRKRHTLAFLLIPTLTFFIWYGGVFFPPSPPTEEGTSLTVLTYNLLQDNRNFAELDAILVEADADIVSLQEANRDMINWAKTNWSESYPYAIDYTETGSLWEYSGRLLLSRYPILDYDFDFSDWGRLNFIEALIQVEDQRVTVYNVHLSPPLPINVFSTESRSQGMNRLLASAANHETVLIMGDFNMTDHSQDYQRISHLYQDSFRQTETGFGTSFPNAKKWHPILSIIPSLIRIDYVFTSDDITPIESRVIRQGVSDHFPLWTKLSLP